MRAELSRVEITGPEALVAAVAQAEHDLRAVGKIIGDLVFTVVDDAERAQGRRAAGGAEA